MTCPIDRDAWLGWWEGKREAPLVQVFARRGGAVGRRDDPTWAFLEEPDPLVAVDRWRGFARDLWCGGAAFPNLRVNVGPVALAAFISDYLDFDPSARTAWFEKEREWEDVPALELRPDAPWLRACLAQVEHLLGATDDGVVAFASLGGALDALAALRGTQNLLLDLMDEPERVEGALARLRPLFLEALDLQAARVLPAQGGCSSWLGVWSDVLCYPLQCDFSAMIGPSHFEEFELPTLADAVARLPRSIYHLDGPGALAHVEALLSLRGLDAIQWVPGAGVPPCEDERWWPMYERVLGAGKLLILQQFADPGQGIDMAMGLGEPGRVLLSLWAGDEEAGRGLLRRAARG